MCKDIQPDRSSSCFYVTCGIVNHHLFLYMYLVFFKFLQEGITSPKWIKIKLYGTWKCYIISRRWNCHISITSHPSGAPDFIPGIFGGDLCCSISFLCSILWTIVCLSVIYIMVIVLSVLVWFTTSDYPFGILKHFFSNRINILTNTKKNKI